MIILFLNTEKEKKKIIPSFLYIYILYLPLITFCNLQLKQYKMYIITTVHKFELMI